jgi:CubicO group peptidase (beta-lactamase class C family)
MKHYFIVIALFCLIFPSVASDIPPSLDRYIERGMGAFDVPGLAIAIVKDGDVVLTKGYGVRDKEGGGAVDADTVFGIASISKSFTAAALAMLVEEGKLQWDAPVRLYLPDFKMRDPYVSQHVTIRDLLTHRCGLGGIAGGTFWYGSTLSSAEIMRRIQFVNPKLGFRQWFAYQSLTYLAAGQLIPVVTGMSWFQFIERRILKPLDMTRSSTKLEGIVTEKNAVVPHTRINGEVVSVDYRGYDNMAPAVSINSSANDMAHYLLMFLNSGQFEGKRLLSPESIYELTKPQMLMHVPFLPPQLEETRSMFCSYGFGWFVQDYKKHKIVAHGGQIDGLFSLVILMPDLKLGMAVMINQEEEGLLDAITNRIMDYYIDPAAQHKDWIPVYRELKRMIDDWRGKMNEELFMRPEKPCPALVPKKDLAGAYRDEAVGDIFITLDGDSLQLRFPNTPSFSARLEHWDRNNFKIHWGDPYMQRGLLEFTMGSGKSVEGLLFKVPKMEDVDFSEIKAVRK